MSYTYPDLNFTQFPEKLDTFKQWLDVAASDGPLVRQYMEAVNQGNMTLANQILTQIPSASQKVVKAVDLNKLSQAIQALERFYKSDVQDYIGNKQAEWLSIINQFDYKNQWQSGTLYLRSNLVSYIIFGKEYIYLAVDNPPLGAPPTDTRYWKRLTIEGQQGVSGVGMSYRYQWEVSDKYDVNDAVTYDGALWIATATSQGVTPSQSSDVWKIIMTLSATTYPIQDTEPMNQNTGDFWFNTSKSPVDLYYLDPLRSPAMAEDIAKGKEAYDDKGRRIVGTNEGTSGPGNVEWNQSSSPLNWNG